MNKTKIITRTAVILALAILFQNLRYLIGAMPNSNLIIGSLVNLCIIVATGAVGIISGLVVCIVTPFIALFQGQLPNVLLAPVTVIGNSVLALTYYAFVKSSLSDKISSITGVIFGAFIKWGVMYFLGVVVVIGIIVKNIPPQKARIISVAFNVPQLFTALIGGILGILIIKALKSKKSVD